MTERWEYMSIVWRYQAERLPSPNDAPKWGFKEDFYVWHPGAKEPDFRPQRDSEDGAVSGPDSLEILNELGAEGWELIGELVRESTVGKRYGWPEAGHPIIRQWTLKRRVGAVAA